MKPCSVNPGGSGGGYNSAYSSAQPAANTASVAVNPATGQPDYSSQWAEYYRSMGMTREADAIEAARTGGAAAVAAQQQQPAGANGAQNGGDYSAQWAEYYRWENFNFPDEIKK